MIKYSAIFAGLVALVLGCDGGRPQAEPALSAPPAPSAPAVRLLQASWDETQQLIASHQGKVVIVDVWSTWCVPCMQEFPGLVDLHREYGDRVACISVNCNYAGAADEPPGTDREKIEAFLVDRGATFENVICTDSDEKLFGLLEAAAIPVVRVYDRQGRLVKQFDNDENEYGEQGFSYEQHIAPLVATLVQRPSKSKAVTSCRPGADQLIGLTARRRHSSSPRESHRAKASRCAAKTIHRSTGPGEVSSPTWMRTRSGPA